MMSWTAALTPPGGLTFWTSYGAPMMLPTVWRGFSELYGSWKIICISRRSGTISLRDSPVMSRPWYSTRPPVGSSSFSMVRPAVDFPQPLSPTRPIVSRSWTARSTPSTALTSPTFRRSRPWVIGKYFWRSEIFRTGSLMRGLRGGVASVASYVVGCSCALLGVRRREPRGGQLVLLGGRQVAAGVVPGRVLVQLWPHRVAKVAGDELVVLAARPEHAARGQVDQR